MLTGCLTIGSIPMLVFNLIRMETVVREYNTVCAIGESINLGKELVQTLLGVWLIGLLSRLTLRTAGGAYSTCPNMMPSNIRSSIDRGIKDQLFGHTLQIQIPITVEHLLQLAELTV
jgi:hypothetical protein